MTSIKKDISGLTIDWLDHDIAKKVLKEGGTADASGSIRNAEGEHLGYVGSSFKRRWEVTYVPHTNLYMHPTFAEVLLKEEELRKLLGGYDGTKCKEETKKTLPTSTKSTRNIRF